MKRIVFSIVLLTALTLISFAGTSKGDSNYKHQTGSEGNHKRIKSVISNKPIQPVDHFTI